MKDTKEEEAHRHSRWLLNMTTCTVLNMFIRLHAGSDDGEDAMASSHHHL